MISRESAGEIRAPIFTRARFVRAGLVKHSVAILGKPLDELATDYKFMNNQWNN